MEQVTKQIDQKMHIINKIQSSLRRKKVEHSTFLEINNLQLPPIPNVFVTFPIPYKANQIKMSSINLPSKKNISPQLQNNPQNKIIQFSHYKTNQVSKIIFPSSYKHRISIQKNQRSTLRSNLYLTIEQKNKNISYQSFSKEKKRKTNHERYLDLSLTPIRFGKQISEFQHTTAQFLPQKSKSIIQFYPPQSKSIVLQVKSSFSSQNDNKKSRKLYHSLPKRQNKTKIQRYSPWQNDQIQQQLII